MPLDPLRMTRWIYDAYLWATGKGPPPTGPEPPPEPPGRPFGDDPRPPEGRVPRQG